MSTQDETIAEELKLIYASKQKVGSGKIQVIGKVNKSIKLDLSSFSLKISTKIWERVARVNPRNFEEGKSLIRPLNIKIVKNGTSIVLQGKNHLMYLVIQELLTKILAG